MNNSGRWIALAAVLAAGVMGLWWTGRQRTATTEQRAQIQKLEAANQELVARTRQLEQEAANLRASLEERGIPAPGPATTRRAPEAPDNTSRLEAVRLLSQMQAKLNLATTEISELKSRTRELEETTEKLRAENKQVTARETELKESLASTKALVQAIERELAAKAQRVTQLEATSQKARDEVQATSQRTAQFAAGFKELEDINRRRESSFTTLQRRYRELTDQYRALAVRLETERDNPVGFAPDVSRIQSTIQTAEDELRQINGLNAQAQRAAQRISLR